MGRARLYSRTQFARISSDGGLVSPRALAVIILMMRSNFVGCSITGFGGLSLIALHHLGRAIVQIPR